MKISKEGLTFKTETGKRLFQICLAAGVMIVTFVIGSFILM
jgi:hypothetical protein